MIIKKIEADSMTAALNRAKEIFGANANIIKTATLKNGKFQIIASAEELAPVAIQKVKKEKQGTGFMKESKYIEEYVSEPNSINEIRQEIAQIKETVSAEFNRFSTALHEMSWGIESKSQPSLAHAMDLLLQNGVGYEDAKDLSVNLPRDIEAAINITKRRLIDRGQYGYKINPGIHTFVGPSGGGKTTALIKIASQLTLQNKKICVVAGDSGSVGNYEQLEKTANILGIDIYSRVRDVPKNIYTYVLIDNPSTKVILSKKVKVHLIVSASSNPALYNKYETMEMDSIIMTKMDELSTAGFQLVLSSKLQIPVSYLSASSDLAEGLKEVDTAVIHSMISTNKDIYATTLINTVKGAVSAQ